MSLGRCSLLEFQAGIERWETYVARYEKLKGKMDDEIKRAGLESLVLEELENHLIFQLQPFEDFRGCALGDRDVRGGENWFKKFANRAKQFFCESSDPIDVVAISSLLSGKGKWPSDSRGGCFKGVAAHFQRDCNASKHMGKQTWSKGNQSKSWSMSELSISGTGKGKEHQGKSKGLSRATKSENKSAKVSCEGKASEMAQVDIGNTPWIHEEWSQDERNDDWSFDEWNDDRSFVGLREDCEQTHVTSVSSFSIESSEWVKTNLDTRLVVDTLPSNFSPEGIGDGNFHDWIPDGEAWQFRGYDENGFPRSPE